MDPETKEAYIKANYPWMQNIAKELIIGKQAVKQAELRRVEADSCWNKVEEYVQVVDSLEKALTLSDEQKLKKDTLISNEKAMNENTLKENKALKRSRNGERVQKYVFIGTTIAAIITALTVTLK